MIESVRLNRVRKIQEFNRLRNQRRRDHLTRVEAARIEKSKIKQENIARDAKRKQEAAERKQVRREIWEAKVKAEAEAAAAAGTNGQSVTNTSQVSSS